MHNQARNGRGISGVSFLIFMVLPSNLELERAINWFNIQHRKNYGADTVSNHVMSHVSFIDLWFCVAGTSYTRTPRSAI